MYIKWVLLKETITIVHLVFWPDTREGIMTSCYVASQFKSFLSLFSTEQHQFSKIRQI